MLMESLQGRDLPDLKSTAFVLYFAWSNC